MLKTALLTNDDPRRHSAEEFIRKIYAARYGALLETFPSRIFALLDNRDEILCAAGLRFLVFVPFRGAGRVNSLGTGALHPPRGLGDPGYSDARRISRRIRLGGGSFVDCARGRHVYRRCGPFVPRRS